MAVKTLVAFDFDHTVVDGNTDIVVRQLYSGSLPTEIEALYNAQDGWTDYMAAIFALLHQTGFTQSAIKECIIGIPLVPGMKDLFDHLNNDRYEVIIVSDSNTLFIDWLLKANHLDKVVHHVYSNPAEFDTDGMLTLKYFQLQDSCKLSSKNMCKGDIVENHVRQRQTEGVSFSRVSYVGDGSNDYCPALRLSKTDYVFPRERHSLERKIKANEAEVKANVIVWKTGSCILSALREMVTTQEK
ncbi:probable phosphatase phospho2 isoform X2 [Watersipora subatra]